MRKGVVSDLSHDGFGIIADENLQDISFILNEVGETVSLGDQVLFEIKMTVQGLMAANVLQVTA